MKFILAILFVLCFNSCNKIIIDSDEYVVKIIQIHKTNRNNLIKIKNLPDLMKIQFIDSLLIEDTNIYYETKGIVKVLNKQSGGLKKVLKNWIII